MAKDAAPRAAQYVYDAGRCGDCHDKMFTEWGESAHSRAARSPAYAAMKARAVAPGSCVRCHEPLVAAGPTISAEGVTCDVCHTIERVTVGRTSEFELRLEQPVRYGPYCDLADHYFHRMGCSPLHETSELCAACHQLGTMYNTFREWQDTRYADDGVECQDCHMPEVRASIAEGAAERDGVGDHRMVLGLGLALEMTARPAGDGITAAVTVENHGAGHNVPTGSADRRLVLRVSALDAEGAEMARAEVAWGWEIMTASGKPAAHTEGVRHGRMGVLIAGEKEARTLALTPAPASGRLRAELLRRPIDHAIAASLGIEPPPDQPILAAELPFRAGSRRRDLARRVRGQP